MLYFSSLPHRQLRKPKQSIPSSEFCSLPHRQLRKALMFAAAQAGRMQQGKV
ncbi:MAG: hypothetical protein H6936_03355 [Burkholderiales bacterium]|nr:hypothetical protein [Burkholderiales bacterium]